MAPPDTYAESACQCRIRESGETPGGVRNARVTVASRNPPPVLSSKEDNAPGLFQDCGDGWTSGSPAVGSLARPAGPLVRRIEGYGQCRSVSPRREPSGGQKSMVAMGKIPGINRLISDGKGGCRGRFPVAQE